MQVSELQNRLKDMGIDIEIYQLRRKIDFYVDRPTRNNRNNYRDLTDDEIKTIMLALCMESVGIEQYNINKLLNNELDRSEVLKYLINSAKKENYLKGWAEE